MLCYLRVADVYRVPLERGDVGDCCQVVVQQTGTAHHMVPEDLRHYSFGNPVLDLQQKVEGVEKQLSEASESENSRPGH